MDSIQLNEIIQSHNINDTLQTRKTHQRPADYFHYAEKIEETKRESKMKINKIIIGFLLTEIILTVALLSKFSFSKSKFLKFCSSVQIFIKRE